MATTTPIEALFDLQRTSLEQGQRSFEQGVEMQRRMVETATKSTLSAQRSMQRQGLEVARQSLVASTGAMWSGDGDQREELGEQFGALVDAQDEAWDAIEEGVQWEEWKSPR